LGLPRRALFRSRLVIRWPLAGLLAVAVLSSVGCQPEDFRDAVPTTVADITRIVDDTALSAPEKRAELQGLGLAPLTINAILRAERTGNQFGGDLRSAYDKVVGAQFDFLTPDEVQIYGDAASDADPNITTNFTDEEGQEIADFFAQFGVQSRDELSAFLDEGNIPPGELDAEVYRGLFVDFDPDLLLEQLP
jgi:hypothetical protein